MNHENVSIMPLQQTFTSSQRFPLTCSMWLFQPHHLLIVSHFPRKNHSTVAFSTCVKRHQSKLLLFTIKQYPIRACVGVFCGVLLDWYHVVCCMEQLWMVQQTQAASTKAIVIVLHQALDVEQVLSQVFASLLLGLIVCCLQRRNNTLQTLDIRHLQ